jgi:transcriptional regulator with XRE-family HTH domain
MKEKPTYQIDAESLNEVRLLIARLRKDAGLTQHELAHNAGIAESSVRNIENGRRLASVKLATYQRLARALNLVFQIS